MKDVETIRRAAHMALDDALDAVAKYSRFNEPMIDVSIDIDSPIDADIHQKVIASALLLEDDKGEFFIDDLNLKELEYGEDIDKVVRHIYRRSEDEWIDVNSLAFNSAEANKRVSPVVVWRRR